MPSPNFRILDVLRLFQQAPRTRPEITDLMDTRKDTAYMWVKHLEKKGFIRIKGHRRTPKGAGRAAVEWEYIKEE